MKIVFLSNYFTHHQKPLCDVLEKKYGEGFKFIETEEMSDERRQLGWEDKLCEKYVHKLTLIDISQEIESTDIVICGTAPECLIRGRINRGKLVYRYSERPLKKGMELHKVIPRFVKWHLMNPKKKPIYMLCASAYTAGDYAKFGLFKGKTYKWGYFPETKKYENIEELLNNKNKKLLLWVGRFVDWKHPDDAIKIAKEMRMRGHEFALVFIGAGKMREYIANQIEELSLENYVYIVDAMTPNKVREYMERAGIFLFTSDFHEGWGAVLNEAMNSGCAVIASHAIGAVPYLISNYENGYIYRSGDIESLCDKIEYLLKNPLEQRRLGRAAYKTIIELWNAEVAANRLINLTAHILKGEKAPDIYSSGPCSKAEIIREDWYKS